MNLAQLKASLALWRRRHAYRQRKLDAAHKSNSTYQIAKWEKLRRQAANMIAERERQIAQLTAKPPFITAAELGLTFQYIWGSKGSVYRGAGHYTAGHRAKDATALKAEMRADHAYHKSLGWGGLSYEAMVADDGTIGLGNPVDRKSAAVASNNTGMVNICAPGTTGDRLTDAQMRSIAWLLDNWHTSAVPKAHRLPVRARSLEWRGHHEWPSQSTACPGSMLQDYKVAW